MSLMDDDDDQQFADLLNGFEEEENEAPAQQSQYYQGEEEEEGDWDALMAAAEAEEAAEEEEAPEEAIAPTRVIPPSRPSSSTQALTQTQVASATPRPKTFADCFATQNSFNAPPPAGSQASTSTTRTTTVKPEPPSSSSSSWTAATPSAAHKASVSSRAVSFGVSAPSAPAASSASSAPKILPKEENDDLRDKISGFKITNRLISSVTLTEKLAGSKVVSLAEVTRRHGSSAYKSTTPSANGSGGAPSGPSGGAFGLLGNWVMFGVLTHKSAPRATSTGKGRFAVWTLSDLNGASSTVMLFGKAFEAYWKITEGAVLALANAEDSSSFVSGRGNSGGSKDAGRPSVCVSIKFAGQVLEVGVATDFAYCKSFKNEAGTFGGTVKGMVRCKNVVNLAKGEYCEYHVQAEYKKLAASRPDLNQSRDRRPVVFAPPAVPPAKAHGANSARITGHMDRSAVLARRAPLAAGATVGGVPTAASASSSATTTLAAALAGNKTTPTTAKRSLGSAASSSADPRAALRSREGARSDAAVAAHAAKWSALRESATSSSRFVQRVAAATQGGAFASSATLTTKDPGIMAAVGRMKQEREGASTDTASTATTSRPISASAAIRPAAFSSDLTPTPSVASGNSTPSSTPRAGGNRASSAVALARTDPAAALAQFRYTAKHPQPAGTPAPIAVPKTNATAAAAPTAATSRAAGTAATTTQSSAATGTNARPSTAGARTHVSVPWTSIAVAASAPAAPQTSSSAFIKAFGGGGGAADAGASSAALANVGLVPMLGRGWTHSGLVSVVPPRPTVMNAGERKKAAQQAAQLEQVARLRAAGLLDKPDPNSTSSSSSMAVAPNGTLKRKSMDRASQPPPTKYTMNPDGSVTLTRVGSASGASIDNGGVTSDVISTFATEQEIRATAKRAKLAAAFGQSAKLDAAAMERVLSQTSKHADLVHESASSIAAQEALFNHMERKEAMAVQMSNIVQQAVKAYRCLQSGCTAPMSEYPLAACKAKGHRCERVEVAKRFFTCQSCKFHMSTLSSKLPTHSCHKCGGTVWLKASLAPLKVDSSDRHLLQLRSEETELRTCT